MNKNKGESLGSGVLDYIYQRVRNQNKNFLSLIVGETGSGKSYAGMKLGEVLDPSFDISKVAFTSQEFITLVRHFEAAEERGEEIRGKVILFDEMQISAGNREWWSEQNKRINQIMSTFRRQNLIVFFTTPHSSFIDSASKKLLHAVFVTEKNRPGYVKPLFIASNPMKDKLYYIHMRVRNKDCVEMISHLKLGLPSAILRKDYEEKKRLFNKKINASASIMLDDEMKLDSQAPDQLDPLDKKLYSLKTQYGTSAKKSAEQLGMRYNSVLRRLKKLRERGFFKEDE
ncbi:hypothetical protein KY314_03445 [Candidatus Woesearchaeota archaeon]|nr:hypothetical protein [Candidatus Woesearchaeota archaeon]